MSVCGLGFVVKFVVKSSRAWLIFSQCVFLKFLIELVFDTCSSEDLHRELLHCRISTSMLTRNNWFCYLVLIGITIGDSSKADKEPSGSRLSTCPIVCPACAVDHIQGFWQSQLPRDKIGACGGSGVLEKPTDTVPGLYMERHIIHVKNNVSETIYLSFRDNGTASHLPRNPSSITIQTRYIITLTSTVPMKWVISHEPQASTKYVFYLTYGGSIYNYKTGVKIDATYFGKIQPYMNPDQIIDVVAQDAFNSDAVTSFSYLQQAHFIQFTLGSYNQDALCSSYGTYESPQNIAASYLIHKSGEGCVTEAATISDPVYVLQIQNRRSSKQIVLQLEGLSFLTKGQKLTLVLKSSFPVEWKLIADFGSSVASDMDLVIESSCSVNTTDLSFEDRASIIVRNFNNLDAEGSNLLEAANTVYSQVNGYSEFSGDVNFVRIKVAQKVPKVPDVSQRQMIMLSSTFSHHCTQDTINVFWNGFIILDARLVMQNLKSSGCLAYCEDEISCTLSARVGECGVFKNERNQLQIQVSFDFGRDLDAGLVIVGRKAFNITCTIPPEIKMQAYPDYERTRPIEFPLYLPDSEPRRNIFIEISADTDEDTGMGVHLDECSIIKHQQSTTNKIQLISGNCPVNQHVSFMVPHTNMHKQTFTFPSSMLDDSSVANFTVQCCAFLCSSIGNQYPKCANEHGMNCRNAQSTNRVCHDDKYEVGPFLHITTSTQAMIIDTWKEESKEMKIELKYMLGISFGMFLVGVLLVFTLCKIRQHYKRVPRRAATEQDQCLLNNKCSYTHASQSESGEISRQTLYVNVNNRSNKIMEKECGSGKSEYMGLYHISPLVSPNYTEKHIVEVVEKGKQEESESPLLGTCPLEHRNCRALTNTQGKSRGHADDTSSADSGVPVEPDKSESSSITSQTAAQVFVSNLTDMKEETV
uniref:uncharacterized protein LOC100179583 isoform X2 n=1 Tax=Ciona intestinalis TaxID=7719 RepID=UPI00089DBEBA|nr:uncharacterized protein LOC100179583 isoform X2 [Ciona intestinalis]|eukprot:XP_018668957.1 uncharacterized protein LOC100179583 isoform X2 [Ciona intestinalis]